MSRQIKFRAWHTRDKCYCDDITTGQLNILNLDLHQIYGGDVIFEQFTGLLDKNGKEIYEGDIVKCVLSPAYIQKQEWLAEVVYNGSCISGILHKCLLFEGYRCNIRPETGQYKCLNDMACNWTLEVIGNIYENPELLKDSKNDSEKS
jgi:uncharacterized phage protein (TIGR01671 family)